MLPTTAAVTVSLGLTDIPLHHYTATLNRPANAQYLVATVTEAESGSSVTKTFYTKDYQISARLW
ncbi:MAG: hypothetical protein M3Z24_01685, partial [Chloroflexota bacterium]|nr:hypothetical protein [Chloroflexota bacterium]